MKKLIIILLLLFVSSKIMAYEFFTPLSDDDINLEIIFDFLVLKDWQQTKLFRKKGIRETNPILGPYPTQSEIDQKIGIGIFFHWFMLWVAPKELREPFQYISIVIELEAISINISYGY